MKRVILALALAASLLALTLPVDSQGLLVVHRKRIANTVPPLPAFDNVVLAVGLNSFNPVGYPEGGALEYGDDEINKPFLPDAPYGINWEFEGSPPYPLVKWKDQNSNTNDLTQTGGSRPTLIVSTPVVVSVLGAGTYTYRGQTAGRGYYNKFGQSTSTTLSVIVWDSGDGVWRLYDAAGDFLDEGSDTSFPWQATWGSITVAAGDGQGMVVLNGTSTGMRGAVELFPNTDASKQGTIYVDIQPLSLAETGIILETGPGGVADNNRISIRMVAGVLTATVFDATAIANLPNSKIKTISLTDRIFICVTFDTTLAAANQVQLYVNNSQTGVTSAAAADLSSARIGFGLPNVGARNNAASAFLTANAWSYWNKTGVDDAAARLVQYNRNQYLKGLYQ